MLSSLKLPFDSRRYKVRGTDRPLSVVREVAVLQFKMRWRMKKCGDMSLARPDSKKAIERSPLSSDAEVIAVAEKWSEGQPSEFFLSGLQKLEFGRCSLFPSWSG